MDLELGVPDLGFRRGVEAMGSLRGPLTWVTHNQVSLPKVPKGLLSWGPLHGGLNPSTTYHVKQKPWLGGGSMQGMCSVHMSYNLNS